MVKVPAPNQRERPTDAAVQRLEGVTGVDPSKTLAKMRAAQKETAVLRQEESRLVAELASHEARYGYPSHWEHERKALLARLASHERDRLLQLGKKPTESLLDQYAHSHGEYRSFLDQAKLERVTMEKLRAKLVDIRSQIETAKAAEVYFERIARREDAIIWFSGKEMSLERG